MLYNFLKLLVSQKKKIYKNIISILFVFSFFLYFGRCTKNEDCTTLNGCCICLRSRLLMLNVYIDWILQHCSFAVYWFLRTNLFRFQLSRRHFIQWQMNFEHSFYCRQLFTLVLSYEPLAALNNLHFKPTLIKRAIHGSMKMLQVRAIKKI